MSLKSGNPGTWALGVQPDCPCRTKHGRWPGSDSLIDKSGAEDSCHLWLGSKTDLGYGTYGGPYHRSVFAHRMAWEHRYGTIPNGLFVLHHCDNPTCVKTEPDEKWPKGHLFIGTQADNNADMKAKGRHEHGDSHHGVKVPHLTVEAARHLYATKFGGYMKIAQAIGVNFFTVREWLTKPGLRK